MANRPSNWYSMTYEQQEDWTRNERKHQRELDDLESDRRSAEESANRDRQSYNRALDIKRSEIYELNDQLNDRDEAIERARTLLNIVLELDDRNPINLERVRALACEAIKELS